MTDAESIRWAILFLRDQPGLPPEAAQAAAALPQLLDDIMDAIPADEDFLESELCIDIETAMGIERETEEDE